MNLNVSHSLHLFAFKFNEKLIKLFNDFEMHCSFFRQKSVDLECNWTCIMVRCTRFQATNFTQTIYRKTMPQNCKLIKYSSLLFSPNNKITSAFRRKVFQFTIFYVWYVNGIEAKRNAADTLAYSFCGGSSCIGCSPNVMLLYNPNEAFEPNASKASK